MYKPLSAITSACLLLALSPAYASTTDTNKVSMQAFIASTYTVNHSTGIPAQVSQQAKQLVTSSELDITASKEALSSRIDLDIANTNNALIIEQAFISWLTPYKNITLHIGTINSPIGMEAQDDPNRIFASQGQITGLLANNITGVMANTTLKNIQVTAGLVNDVYGTDRTYSALISAKANPIKSLTASGSYLIADNGPFAIPGPGSAWNVFASYNRELLSINGELYGDANRLHIAYAFSGQYRIDKNLSLAARYDSVSYARQDRADTTALSVALESNITANLRALIEWRNDDNGQNITTSQLLAKAIVTLGGFN